MNREVVPVTIRGLVPANTGCALFLGNDEKVFVIHVEMAMGSIISMFLNQSEKERPLTHDLMLHIWDGFGISLERVIITELKGTTYYARLILQQENELGRKILEVDARPSDSIALATARKKPLLVARDLFDQEEDMSELLERINEGNEEGNA